ncbi:MAG: phosphoribosylanthranilate isomerase [Acidobacteriales bacterium]|nr:phosphoribosylanthranilate isomerase [Terriglobales bacterium]
MMVKICGITNPEDATAAVEAGASAIGFNFYPKSPRFVEPEHAAEIIAGLVPGILKVGVFVNEPAGRVESIARTAGLDVVQLHGAAFAPVGMRSWRAVPMTKDFDFASLDVLDAEAFLIDAFAGDAWGGTGRTWDWTLAAAAKQRIILAGGLDATNVREAIRKARPWGVDACSRIESSPGKKDHAKMRAFIQAAFAEER